MFSFLISALKNLQRLQFERALTHTQVYKGTCANAHIHTHTHTHAKGPFVVLKHDKISAWHYSVGCTAHSYGRDCSSVFTDAVETIHTFWKDTQGTFTNTFIQSHPGLPAAPPLMDTMSRADNWSSALCIFFHDCKHPMFVHCYVILLTSVLASLVCAANFTYQK